jgi:hypothetical protein
VKLILGIAIGLLITAATISAHPKIFWRGKPVVHFEGERNYIGDVEIGFRDDGVVVWRKTAAPWRSPYDQKEGVSK